MMNNISSGKNMEAKQEGGGGDDGNNKEMIQKPTATSSRQWGGFKNPRIVRVSPSLGGKDRHSKVCTIRGLRDRRIRLSVPTAIQLYDLQDRLGLSQPSKVVDWLLDATKLEIDKLPPLHFPHQFQELLPPHHQLDNESLIWKTLNGKEKFVEDNGGVLPYTNNNNFFPFPFMNNHSEISSILPPQFHHSQNNNNLYFPSNIPPLYMPAAEAAAADPRHHINTHLPPQHYNLVQNPMIPPTFHFIKSYENNNNNNPEKSSRGS